MTRANPTGVAASAYWSERDCVTQRGWLPRSSNRHEVRCLFSLLAHPRWAACVRMLRCGRRSSSTGDPSRPPGSIRRAHASRRRHGRLECPATKCADSDHGKRPHSSYQPNGLRRDSDLLSSSRALHSRVTDMRSRATAGSGSPEPRRLRRDSLRHPLRLDS
jgi:hypothetical protein